MRELDRKFASEGRSIASVIDNCPAHSHIENLKSIKLFFLPPNTTSSTQPIDDPFKDLQDEINVLRNVQRDLVPEDVNASSLIDVDSEVSAVQPPLTDSKILVEFFKTGDISNGDDERIDASNDIEEVPVECPGKTDLLNALELLQKFSLFSVNDEAIQVNCLNIEQNIDNYFMKRIKQARIKDYFEL